MRKTIMTLGLAFTPARASRLRRFLGASLAVSFLGACGAIGDDRSLALDTTGEPQTAPIGKPGGGGEACIDQLVAAGQTADAGLLDDESSHMNVPMLPNAGYHLYTTQAPGRVIYKSIGMRTWMRIYDASGTATTVESKQDTSNHGWYAIADVGPGKHRIVATSTDNLASCPHGTTNSVYTISILK